MKLRKLNLLNQIFLEKVIASGSPAGGKTKEKNMFKKSQLKEPDLQLFAVYDSKVDCYSDPVPAINSLDILREFHNAFSMADAPVKNKYYKNAEDYSLFKIGGYDKKTGTLVTHAPTHVVNFHELRSQTDMENKRALSST